MTRRADQLDAVVEGLTKDLRTAVGGDDGDDFDTLIWRVVELRRRTEDAHNALDMLDVPRELPNGADTLHARIEALRPGTLSHAALHKQRRETP